MLQMDVSAMMGYTGAIYKQFFGSALGMSFTFGVLILWAAVPLYFAIRVFKKKDFWGICHRIFVTKIGIKHIFLVIVFLKKI